MPLARFSPMNPARSTSGRRSRSRRRPPSTARPRPARRRKSRRGSDIAARSSCSTTSTPPTPAMASRRRWRCRPPSTPGPTAAASSTPGGSDQGRQTKQRAGQPARRGRCSRLDKLAPGAIGSRPARRTECPVPPGAGPGGPGELDPPAIDREGRDRLKRAFAALEPVPTETAVEGYARTAPRRDPGEARRPRRDPTTSSTPRSKLKPPPPARRWPRSAPACSASAAAITRRSSRSSRPGSTTWRATRLALDVRLGAAVRGIVRALRGSEAETDAFRRARTLRGSDRPEAQAGAPWRSARTLDAPPPHADPEAWDLLGEAALGLETRRGASRLVAGSAPIGRSNVHQPAEAARLRLRAGAILYQAGDYAGADALLTRRLDRPRRRPVAAQGRAAPRPGPRPGHRGRSGTDGRAGYVAALRDVVRAFPDDPRTAEARWLLGGVEADDGQRGRGAGALASRSPPATRAGSPRGWPSPMHYLPRRSTSCGSATTPARSANFREASAFLRESTQPATDPSAVTEIDLATARLDLTPGAGRPELARSLCDRLAHAAGSPEQHARARVCSTPSRWR